MAEIVRAWNIYLDNKKVATATSMESTLEAAGELQKTAEGVVARAQGVAEAKVTLNTITTVGGKAATQKLVTALLNNVPVKLTTGVVDGKIREYKEMWCHSEQLSAEFANGTAKGVYQFEGGPPKISG